MSAEVRVVVGAGLAVGVVGVAASISPTIDGFLSTCAAWGFGVGSGVTVLYLVGRSLWLSWLIEWECTRTGPEYTLARPPAKGVESDA